MRVHARVIATLALLFALWGIALAADTPAPKPDASAPVLVIVDIQRFYFEGGMLPLDGPGAASANAKLVLQHFRQKGWPVVHVQHLPAKVDRPDAPGLDAQYAIHPDVAPLAGERIVGKHFANSFRDTTLWDVLKQLGAKKLVIVGMQTHMCVEATTRAAADMGYEVTVIHDACATRPLSFGETKVASKDVHAAALAAIVTGGYGRVISAAEFIKGTN